MKKVLKWIGLIENISITLQISKIEFITRLQNIMDEESLGIFFDLFDGFSSSKNEFKGQVNFDGFKLKRRRHFFERRGISIATANGTFSEINGKLLIETEISSFNNYLLFSYFILFAFFSFFIFTIVRDPKMGPVPIPLFLIQGTILLLIPYLIARRSTKRLKYELERDFYYLTKNNE